MSRRATSTPQPPPLTYDDLIDLHFLLEADDLLLQLLHESVSRVRTGFAPTRKNARGEEEHGGTR